MWVGGLGVSLGESLRRSGRLGETPALYAVEKRDWCGEG